MQIKTGQSGAEIARAGTIGGLLVSAYLQAGVANTPILATDWLPAQTQIMITLSRHGQVITLMNSNLLLLGTYAMRKNNFNSFVNGEALVYPSGGVKEVLLRTAWLKFESAITLLPGDVLTANVQFVGGLAAAIDSAVSYLDFTFQPATIRERGIPCVNLEVVQTNSTQQSFVHANGVKHIEFMNFDQTTWATPVIVQAAIQSDKLNYSANLTQ